LIATGWPTTGLPSISYVIEIGADGLPGEAERLSLAVVTGLLVTTAGADSTLAELSLPSLQAPRLSNSVKAAKE
jgi:hypothetical protein